MKKSIYLILTVMAILLILLFTVSCTDSDVNTTLSDSSVDSDPTLVEAVAVYYSFESACRMATNVVFAEYQGKSVLNDLYVEYRFKVSDRLLGSCDDEIAISAQRARVSVPCESGMKLSYSNEEIPLTVGREYLLPLYSSPTAYDVKTRYQFIGGLAIDMEELSQSTMYGQKNISSHVKGAELDTLSKQSVQSYVGGLICDNVTAKTVPVAANLQELVDLSPEILVVKVGKLERTMKGVYQDTYVYYCTVKDTLKTDDPFHESEVTVRFFANSVKEGDTVIVFADNLSDFYYFVSRNTYIDSVQPIDKKDEIVSLIEATE